MTFDGVVVKINNSINTEYYLFMLDPDINELQDGINISHHSCYDDMKLDQVMVVKVTLKDGTLELDDVDLYEFIHGDKYGRHDIFIYIQDILLYDIGKLDNFNNVNSILTLEDIIKDGEFNNIAIELINKSKEHLEKNKK